jgi:hypothetical protein
MTPKAAQQRHAPERPPPSLSATLNGAPLVPGVRLLPPGYLYRQKSVVTICKGKAILMRRFLLVALLAIAITPLGCGRLRKDAPTSGGDGAPANTIGDVDAGGDPTEEGALPADKLDVCSHLTREEVEAALGRPVKEPMRGTELSSRRSGTLTSSCMFGGDEGFVSLGVKRQAPNSTTRWNAAEAYEELKDRIFKAHSGESFVRLAEVSGIGADAFAETKEETVNFQTTELRVLSKHSILTVRVVGLLAATSSFEAAKILAGKAVPRLEQHERAGIIPGPDSSSTAPEAGANHGDDKRQRMPEKSRAERRTTKEVEQPPRPGNTKATTAKAGKTNSRRADEANSKQSKKPVKESTKRTPDRTKREATKAARATPRSKKRP